MRRTSSALVLVMLIAGCSGAEPAASERAPSTLREAADSTGEAGVEEVELRFDETTRFGELTLRWLEIEDSRCPTGVDCFWAGQIEVIVEVSREGREPVEVDLVLRIGSDPEPAEAFGFVLTLQDVEPYPKHGQETERGSYVAHIAIAEV